MDRAATLLFGLTVAAALLSTSTRAAKGACDPALKSAPNSPFGYREYGDRCEGIYIQPVSGTTLVIASLTKTFANYSLKSDNPLNLTWTAPRASEVHLRAQGVKRRLYYRMDLVLPSTSNRYTWPIHVLSGLGITREDVGVLGWIQHAVGGTDRLVYLPLSIQQGSADTLSSTYQLGLVPGRELSEIYVTLERLDDNGRVMTRVRDGKKLEYGYYPAEREVDIPLPELVARGLYRLELGAVLEEGGSATSEIWLFTAGG